MKLCPVCKQQYDTGAQFCPADGTQLADTSPSVEVFGGRFVVQAPVKSGQTGELFRGTDQTTGATVAIKRVAPAISTHPQVATRIDRELSSLAGLATASSATLLGSGRVADAVWVATEWIPDAQSLEAVVSARGPLPLAEALAIVARVGEALLDAGKLGVIHRDLAPKNVLVAGSQVKLINWAVPVVAHPKIAGVPAYVSPENVEGRLVDQRSNIYSLAAILFFALTGAPPFGGDVEALHRAHVSTPAPAVSSRASVPAALDAVIAKALDKSAARRYMTLRQFLDELANAAAQAAAPSGAVGAASATKSEPTALGAPALIAPAMPSSATIAGVASPVIGSPFARSGAAELGQTLVGVIGGTDVNARTKQVDAIDPSLIESLRQPPAATPMIPTSVSASEVAAPASVVVAPVTAELAAAAPAAPAPAPEPALASPVVPAVAYAQAAPQAQPVSHGRAGSEAPRGDGEDGKSKFRETLWFKKGELDALSAQNSGGSDATVDTLPIEDRYNDDGTISGGDAQRYSLRTGNTEVRMARMTDGKRLTGSMSEDDLVSEMKAGRGKWILIGAATLAVVLIVILMFAL